MFCLTSVLLMRANETSFMLTITFFELYYLVSHVFCQKSFLNNNQNICPIILTKVVLLNQVCPSLKTMSAVFHPASNYIVNVLQTLTLCLIETPFDDFEISCI